jgi:uncharacterized protein YjbJ (UPF0337 family)
MPEMNTEQLTAQWKQLRFAAKQKFDKLTEDDLNAIQGQFDRLIEKLEQRYAIAKEEARHRASEWLQTMKFDEHQPERKQPQPQAGEAKAGQFAGKR